MVSVQREAVDLVVPAGTTFEFGPDNAEAEKYRQVVTFNTPEVLVELGLVSSLDHLERLFEASRKSKEAVLRSQQGKSDRLDRLYESMSVSERWHRSFLAYSDGLPFGETFLFWQIIRNMPSEEIRKLGGGRSGKNPWEGHGDKIREAWFVLHSLVIEPGATLIVNSPFLNVSGGALCIEEDAAVVLGDNINTLHIQARGLQGKTRWVENGELTPYWLGNLVGRGRNGWELAPERVPAKDGTPGKRGADGKDAVCKDWWEEIFSSDEPPTPGGTGGPGGAPENGYNGWSGEPGKTIIVNAENYLGGITVDCSGGWGEWGGDGGDGGDGGPGGDGGWGGTCKPNANGGSGGRGHDGGCAGVGGRGGTGGNAFIYYRNNPSGEQPHFNVEGGPYGSHGSDGAGGRGGAPGRPGRGIDDPSPRDTGPVPQRGPDGNRGWHVNFPFELGPAGQCGFVKV